MPVDSNSGEHAARVARAFGLKGRYHQLVDEVVTPVVVIEQLDTDSTPPEFGTPPASARSSAVSGIEVVGASVGVAWQFQAGPVPARLVAMSFESSMDEMAIFVGSPVSVGGLARGYWRDIRPGSPSASFRGGEVAPGSITDAPLWVFPIGISPPPVISVPANGVVTFVSVHTNGGVGPLWPINANYTTGDQLYMSLAWEE